MSRFDNVASAGRSGVTAGSHRAGVVSLGGDPPHGEDSEDRSMPGNRTRIGRYGRSEHDPSRICDQV